MADVLVDFAWDVEAAGYRWEASDYGSFVLTPVRQSRVTFPCPTVRTYKPHEEDTGLFRVLAATPIDRDQITKFANKYGLLGLPDERLRTTSNGLRGEPFDDWAIEIADLSGLVMLWDLIQSGDTERLNKYVFECPPGDKTIPQAIAITRTPCETLADALESEPGWLYGSRLRDFKHPVFAVETFVRRLLSDHLAEVTAPRVEQGNGTDSLLSYSPKGLIGALWLQFASAIAKPRSFPQCRACGRPFEVSRTTSGRRPDAVFCSDKCKSRDYRARVRSARTLQTSGKSPDESARVFDADTRTGRRRVRSRRRQRKTQ